ncbi:hypothetical protein JR316_0011146 [Psilocybe cubensis]|uniref:Uncharacterized protein n=2 Tax=Psilocybe cubensis TaxID=181762 RepID=A0A8H7XKL0_PSICU|nr:hypothetical protein JR316_0011146 [Psilocybe cubensis]KAH9477227.1 hypothetical protein JR316_0011146 [Psilocybe cubensis]
MARAFLLLSTVMFALSTTHVGLGVRELLDGFVYQSQSTPGGPPAFFRENVFPKRKSIYIFNTLLGDALLVWRVYTIYGQNWLVAFPSAITLLGTTITGLKTVAADVMSEHSSVFDPSILNWVTATFALTISTQVISTALIAGRIYTASRPYTFTHSLPAHPPQRASSERTAAAKTLAVGNSRSPVPPGDGLPFSYTAAGEQDNQRAKYLSLVFIVAESGAVYTSAALIQLITYLLNMNAGVILELMLAQLSAVVPMVIVVRVGLGLAYEGPYNGNGMHRGRSGYAKRWSDKEDVHHLSTFHAAEGNASQTRNDDDVGEMATEKSGDYTSIGSKTQVGTVKGENSEA